MGQVFLLNVKITFSLINHIHAMFVPYIFCFGQLYLVPKLNDHTHFKVGITLFYSQGNRVRESKLLRDMCLINNTA